MKSKWVVIRITGAGAAPEETDVRIYENRNKANEEFENQSINAITERARGRSDVVILAQVIEAYEIREKDMKILH